MGFYVCHYICSMLKLNKKRMRFDYGKEKFKKYKG